MGTGFNISGFFTPYVRLGADGYARIQDFSETDCELVYMNICDI